MARRRAGLTQRELADRLGLRQATIARWERGDRQVGIEDVELVAGACGLHLEAHLVVEDRSWWSQIALQLELDPLDRLRQITPSGSPDLASALGQLRVSWQHLVVIGEVAGALQGWPLVLGGGVIEACAQAADGAPLLTAIGPRVARDEYELSGGARLRVIGKPAGTSGLPDLWRGSEPVDTPDGAIRVASLVDLLRIADASTHRSARLEALAHQAVLDVKAARAGRAQFAASDQPGPSAVPRP
ncbi:MAG TPA: helix-turn-helix transcriptional regulator [Solirubrobacteraceae bacterium]|nr:helix-turn-helix transcriptional regulator [Solirubrobacteraceae bacterium]